MRFLLLGLVLYIGLAAAMDISSIAALGTANDIMDQQDSDYQTAAMAQYLYGGGMNGLAGRVQGANLATVGGLGGLPIAGLGAAMDGVDSDWATNAMYASMASGKALNPAALSQLDKMMDGVDSDANSNMAMSAIQQYLAGGSTDPNALANLQAQIAALQRRDQQMDGLDSDMATAMGNAGMIPGIMGLNGVTAVTGANTVAAGTGTNSVVQPILPGVVAPQINGVANILPCIMNPDACGEAWKNMDGDTLENLGKRYGVDRLARARVQVAHASTPKKTITEDPWFWLFFANTAIIFTVLGYYFVKGASIKLPEDHDIYLRANETA